MGIVIFAETPMSKKIVHFWPSKELALFFQATSLGGDVELWKSNGTTATTLQVRNIKTTGSSSLIGLTNVAG